MKLSADQILSGHPELDREAVLIHIDRLEEDYFQRFTTDQIAGHIRAVTRLSESQPIEVLIEVENSQQVMCTIIAFDYPAIFSLLTGIFAATGFSIDQGDVFTYRHGLAGRGPQTPRQRRSRRRPAIGDRRRIIDHFVGTLAEGEQIEAWSTRVRAELNRVGELLEKNSDDALLHARQQVNELVTRRLADHAEKRHAVLFPVEVELTPEPTMTHLRLVAQDTPAFLYALSTALALSDLSIERMRISTTAGRVEDDLWFVDARHQPIRDAQRLDRIRFTVLLTKQFTYYLDRAPDPYRALSRFERMVRDITERPEHGPWLEMLGDPRAMQELARLLGASDYLWEEFIRLQYEALLPVLNSEIEQRQIAPPIDTVEQRLRDTVAQAGSPADRHKALNQFKDREIFLIDLSHILDPAVDFSELSRRLTLLAEAVVRVASELAWEQLVEEYGEPRVASGASARCSIFGLGKLGGQAIGYASDIELLFVYDRAGQTDGETSIENAQFFEQWVRETNRHIEAKQEGIFKVDLRLRPWGANAKLAVPADTLESYYRPGGGSHSFERMALVRLRAIAGDRALGMQVEQLRDRLIYQTANVIDLSELWQLRKKQYREKRGREFNAKFGVGGLADVEYTIQILQILHGGTYPALRTPSVRAALAALTQAEIIPQTSFDRCSQAYAFFRKLINGLRMLRGSAKDLILPPADSLEYRHLAKRMSYEDRGEYTPDLQLQLDLAIHTASVREFVRRRFGMEAIADEKILNFADLILTESLTPEMTQHVAEPLNLTGTTDWLEAIRAMSGLTPPFSLLKLTCFIARSIATIPTNQIILTRWAKIMTPQAKNPYLHQVMLENQTMLMNWLTTLDDDASFSDLLEHPDKLNQRFGSQGPS